MSFSVISHGPGTPTTDGLSTVQLVERHKGGGTKTCHGYMVSGEIARLKDGRHVNIKTGNVVK